MHWVLLNWESMSVKHADDCAKVVWHGRLSTFYVNNNIKHISSPTSYACQFTV